MRQAAKSAVSALQGPGLFRLFLASIVVVAHATPVDLGIAAVDIFFCLSGYWIYATWNRRYASLAQAYSEYMIARLWRLLPVFLLCSAIAWIVYLHFRLPPPATHWVHEALSSIFILGYLSADIRPNGPAWSLDIEMQFYILAPLLFLLLARSRWIFALCLAASAAAGLLRDEVSLLPYVAFFAMGATAAREGWHPTRRAAWTSLAASGTIVAFCLISPWRNILLVTRGPDSLVTYNIFCIVLVFTILPWTIFTTKQPGGRHDRALGDISYSLYLLHFSVVTALIAYRDHSIALSLPEKTSLGFAAFAISGAGAWVIWYFFDRPLSQWRNAWKARQKAAEPLESREA